jgi:hypothetical protein
MCQETCPGCEDRNSCENKLDTTKAALRGLLIEHAFWVRNVVSGQFGGVAGAARNREQWRCNGVE